MDVATECSDRNEERKIERMCSMKKANGSLLRWEYWCVEVKRETGQQGGE